jgi:hypothetical protein
MDLLAFLLSGHGGGGTSDAYTKAQTDALLAEKQNVLTFDDTPTANSNNPVKSGGVKTLADSMEADIDDTHIAQRLMIIAHMQHGESIAALEKATVQEVGSVTLNNTISTTALQKFLFNNSKASVALTNRRDNLNYTVVIVGVTGGGNIGEVEVSERLVNGFKLNFTGSATSVTVTYAVIGGYDK